MGRTACVDPSIWLDSFLPFFFYNEDIQIPSKHNRFIILYHFQATCFDTLEPSSGPQMN